MVSEVSKNRGEPESQDTCQNPGDQSFMDAVSRFLATPFEHDKGERKRHYKDYYNGHGLNPEINSRSGKPLPDQSCPVHPAHGHPVGLGPVLRRVIQHSAYATPLLQQ